jgi:hypothetical protein
MAVFPLDRGHNGREVFRNASHRIDSATCLRFGSRWTAPGAKRAMALLPRGFGKRSRCKHRIRHLFGRSFCPPPETTHFPHSSGRSRARWHRLNCSTNKRLSSPCDLIGALPLYAVKRGAAFDQRAGQMCVIRSGSRRWSNAFSLRVWHSDDLSRRWAKMPQQIASTLNKDRSIHR